MGKLRIGGAWSGVLEVELDEWTVATLREEVAKKSVLVGLQFIYLISAGRVLRDGDGTEKLSQLGVKNNAKILASKVSTDQERKSLKEEFLAEEERSKRLSRLNHFIGQRHADGSLLVEDFNLELENQSGEKVQLGAETDQQYELLYVKVECIMFLWSNTYGCKGLNVNSRAVMMGLKLHANAKALIKRQQCKDALKVLTMGEEAFSLCDPKVIEVLEAAAVGRSDCISQWSVAKVQGIPTAAQAKYTQKRWISNSWFQKMNDY